MALRSPSDCRRALRRAAHRLVRTGVLIGLLLVQWPAAAREAVTFILAQDSPGHAFFASARDYYMARPQLGGHLVTTARSLADVREFLARSPLRGTQPWGRVRLVAHGSQWEGLRVPVFADGALAGWQELQRVLAQGEFPPLDRQLLDRRSVLEIDSCGLGRRPALLRRFSRLLAGNDRLRVQAARGYVWFGRMHDESGVVSTMRQELPYSARVVAGAPALDDGLREAVRTQWRKEHGYRANLQFVAVPVLIDVPLNPVVDTARETRRADAALRHYGLERSQLRWRRVGTRLQGEGLIVVAAPDAVARLAELPQRLAPGQPASDDQHSRVDRDEVDPSAENRVPE